MNSTHSSSNQNNFKSNNERLLKVEKSSNFILETGECLGTCPVFTFYYSSNDSIAAVKSTKNILTPGIHLYSLSPKEVAKIDSLLNSIKWSSLSDKYQTQLKDLPTIKFLVKKGDFIKSVTIEGKEPENLFKLKEAIIEEVKSYSWEKLK